MMYKFERQLQIGLKTLLLMVATACLLALPTQANAFDLNLTSVSRLTHQGTDGDIQSDTYLPAVAYNDTAKQYGVVWQGTAPESGSRELYFQLFDGSHNPVSSPQRISDMGVNTEGGNVISAPDIVFDSKNQKYMVVWSGDSPGHCLTYDRDNMFGDGVADHHEACTLDNRSEVWSQQITASGVPKGSNHLVTFEELPYRSLYGESPDPSDPLGTDLDTGNPTVAFSATQDQYIVVYTSKWAYDEGYPTYNYIKGTLLDSSGEPVPVGTINADSTEESPQFQSSFPIKTLLSQGWTSTSADVTYNSIEDEYYVVWSEEHDDGNYEISGTSVRAKAQQDHEPIADLLDEETVLTDMEDGNNLDGDGHSCAAGSDDYSAGAPSVAYNQANNEYLVVFYGTDCSLGMPTGKEEIFYQRMNRANEFVGSKHATKISSMGPSTDKNYDGTVPTVDFNPVTKEYLVVWIGFDESNGGKIQGVFGQRLDSSGNEIGDDDFQIVASGDTNHFKTGKATVASSTTDENYFAVWSQTDNVNTAYGEYEIFGRNMGTAPPSETSTTPTETAETYTDETYTDGWYDGYDYDNYTYSRKTSTAKKSTAKKLWVKTPKKQSLLKKKKQIFLYALCSTSCSLSGQATGVSPKQLKKFKGKIAKTKARGYQQRTLKLKLGKKTLARIARATRRKKTTKLRVKVVATFSDGTKKSVSRTIKLK